MSKYTDMLADKYRCHCGACEVQKGNVSEEECKICSHYVIREALQIADRLEQADAEEMAIRIGCSKCRHTMCRRNPKYEGEQDLFEVECDLFRRFKNDAILVLADIRGDNNGKE